MAVHEHPSGHDVAVDVRVGVQSGLWAHAQNIGHREHRRRLARREDRHVQSRHALPPPRRRNARGRERLREPNAVVLRVHKHCARGRESTTERRRAHPRGNATAPGAPPLHHCAMVARLHVNHELAAQPPETTAASRQGCSVRTRLTEGARVDDEPSL